MFPSISRLLVVLLCLCMLAACNSGYPAPTATPRPQPPPIELNNTLTSSHGITLHYPEGWRAEESGRHVILSDQQDALIGGSIFIPSDEELQKLGASPTPHKILTEIVIHHAPDQTPADDIETFEINGQPAASYYYSREIDELYMVVALPGERFAILTFAAPHSHLEHFDSTARDILASVEYNPR